MIDEDLVRLAKAAREWPGGAVHVSTTHRFRLEGVRGIKLECLRVGGRWCTSREAINRFIVQLNPEARRPMSGTAVSARSPAVAMAEMELERDGL